MSRDNKDLIVGLDIGTTKICAVVGEVSGSDVNIVGIGTHPSVGLRKGSDFTAKLNETLQALADDGTVDTLAKKYPNVMVTL